MGEIYTVHERQKAIDALTGIAERAEALHDELLGMDIGVDTWHMGRITEALWREVERLEKGRDYQHDYL